MAWMVFQVVSLSALVPRDCCQAHAHKSTTPASHHNSSDHETAAGAHCPMPSTEGKPCPMHQEPANPHPDHGTPPDNDRPVAPVQGCAMRGSCDGPTVGFIALLSQAGELNETTSAPVDMDMQAAIVHVAEQIVSRLESPDPPPPRA